MMAIFFVLVEEMSWFDSHCHLHGFWEKGLAPWDVAAGGLICKEAGLDVFCLDEQSFSPFSSSIIACSPSLKVELLSQLKS